MSLIRKPRGEKTVTTVKTHLAHFNWDPDAFLTAVSLAGSPSTLASYTSATKKIFSASGRDFSEYARHARFKKLTLEGRPRPAQALSALQLRRLIQDSPPTAANLLKVMILTAARAADLRHIHAEKIEHHWRLEYLCREEENGELVPPKSDREATRRIIKWIPNGDFDLSPGTLSTANWDQINNAIKAKFAWATPHSIRGSVVKILEANNFDSTSIALVTGHAVRNVPGAMSYLNHLPRDLGTLKALEMTRLLARTVGIKTTS
jgi:hypothetical protein